MNAVAYPDEPGFKVDGTSQLAAQAVKPNAATLREQCIAVVRNFPCTADECANRLGVSLLSIRPRFSELRVMGKIEDTGLRRRNDSGATANVWKATELL